VYYEYLCNNRKAGTYTDIAYTSQKEGDFEFIKTRYGTIITDHTGGKVDRLEIPRNLGGMAVKGIVHEAFYNKDISSVQLPNGLTFIGGVNAFSSNKLTSVNIPNSVIYIGDYAFSDNQLSSVVIGNNVSCINQGAFFNNPLTNITIPDSVNYIGHGTFEKNQLTSVIIGNGVTSIEADAFLNNQLTSVTIPNSVVFIGSRAFRGSKLTSVTIGNDVTLTDGDFPSFDNSFNGVYHDNRKRAGTYLYSASDYYWSMAVPPVHNDDDFEIDGKETFRNYPGIITKYTGSDIWITIPSQIGGIPIKGIGPGAFDKKNLRSVTIPDSVIYIGWGAFQDNKLMSVIIPDSVTDIGEEAFRNNYLKSITIGGDLYLPDGIHFQAFSQSFINFYRDNGRKAGTYVVVEGKGWERVIEE
jgi:hypothetical protein